MPLQTLEVDGVYWDVVSDERVFATSYDPSYPPQEARLSGAGWCADSVCNTEPTRQYLTIDYGIEVVLQAIVINATSQGFYVTLCMIEYTGSDQVFACVIDLVSNSTVSATVCILMWVCIYSFISTYICTSIVPALRARIIHNDKQ